MKILAAKPKPGNIFNAIGLISVEPLELEYLCAALSGAGHECSIYDGTTDGRSFTRALTQEKPEILMLSGYVIHAQRIIDCARRAKRLNPAITIMVGGVHAELNWREFQNGAVDVVWQSGDFESLLRLVDCISQGKTIQLMQRKFGIEAFAGLSLRLADGSWLDPLPAALDIDRLPMPDRSHFIRNTRRYHYLDRGPCAMLKTAWGCPCRCNFCYCTQMNGGRYAERSMNLVLDEIGSIDCNLIWIIDDSFTIRKDRVLEFIEGLRRRGIHKRFILYSRADFVAAEPGLLRELASVGVIDIIVGLESVKETELSGYDKRVSLEQNHRCVENLRSAGIACTGLFIMGPDSSRADVRALYRWIKEQGILNATLSVFTPFPGTAAYAAYADRLDTVSRERFDLLHLLVPPGRISAAAFHFELYWFYWKLLLLNLRSPRGGGFFSLIPRIIVNVLGYALRSALGRE